MYLAGSQKDSLKAFKIMIGRNMSSLVMQSELGSVVLQLIHHDEMIAILLQNKIRTDVCLSMKFVYDLKSMLSTYLKSVFGRPNISLVFLPELLWFY